MYRILVPVDHSEERALEQAAYVTGLPLEGEVAVSLLFVFGPETRVNLPDELKPFKSADRVASVQAAAEHLAAAGIDATILEDSGDAATDILDAATDEDVDEIVMGSHKRGPLAEAIFGSVGERVINNTALPVTVVGEPTG